MTLFAVHISDGPWDPRWLAGGFVATAVMLWFSTRRLRDEEIPRLALLTAAFFVASEIRIPIPLGPGSVHMLLSGLMGVLLGLRAVPAIVIGLLLQALLFQHGGYYTLGINSCVMTIPALLSFGLYQATHRFAWVKTPIAGVLLVGIGAVVWFMAGLYSLTLVFNTSLAQLDDSAVDLANSRLLNPWFVAGSFVFAACVTVFERRLENAPEFPLGFLIGVLSVLVTAALNGVVLLSMGETTWPTPPLILVIAHLPIAVVEGLILGFVVGFLAKVKPEMLGIVNHGGHGEYGELPRDELCQTGSKSDKE